MYLIEYEILYATVIVFSILTQYIHARGLIEVFQWKQMDFYNRGDRGLPKEAVMFPVNEPSHKNSGAIVFPDQLAYRPLRNKRDPLKVTSRDVNIASRLGDVSGTNSESHLYIPYNNVPMGATHFNGRLFVTMPRRRVGIPSTLNYIDMLTDGNNPSPKLYAYPNFETNYLNPNLEPNLNRLISVYRTTVDACKRLWFIDTGMLEYPGNQTQVQRPSIWVINLLTDSVIRRFEINQDIAATGQGLASITIDVSSNRCNEAFAYMPDLVNGQLCVYSFRENRIWRFTHNYFNFDPLGGDLFIGGQSFRWDDGIFSITLAPLEPTGYRTALFHAMASTNEFMVSTEVLQNETYAQRSDHGNDFRLVGNRGPKRQSTMHEYDSRTNVVFYAEIQRNGVGCWNANKIFSPENHGTVAQDADRMIYPSDLTIDDEGTMWVMTNSMPIYIYSNLDPNVVNFRVWKQKTVDAITYTICESI